MRTVLLVSEIGLWVDYSSDFGREVYRGMLTFARKDQSLRVRRISHLPLTPYDWQRMPRWVVGQFGDEMSIQELKERGHVVVNISGRLPIPNVPTVRIDDDCAGRMAAEYYLGRGFRHFAFVGYQSLAFSGGRESGFVHRLREEHLFPIESVNTHQVEAGLHAFLQTLPRPCAVYCANDELAAKTMRACFDQSLSVPEEIGILGTDNDEFLAEGAKVPISSVDVSAQKIGYEAAKWVCDPELPDDLLLLIPPSGIVERVSTDLMAVPDELVAELLRRIQVRYREPIQVPDLLEGLPLQRRMLERRFQKAVGRSMHQEIRRLRLDAARDLLVHSDMSVEEIALATGIGESRQLSAIFKKELGMTPTAWRRQYQLR